MGKPDDIFDDEEWHEVGLEALVRATKQGPMEYRPPSMSLNRDLAPEAKEHFPMNHLDWYLIRRRANAIDGSFDWWSFAAPLLLGLALSCGANALTATAPETQFWNWIICVGAGSGGIATALAAAKGRKSMQNDAELLKQELERVEKRHMIPPEEPPPPA